MDEATSAPLVSVATGLTLRLASINHIPAILGLIEEASCWLRGKHTDQWASPWPSRRMRDRRVRNGIELRRTWIVWDGDTPAATMTVYQHPDGQVWPFSRDAPAIYVHRLVVRRAYAGINLGGLMIDWAAQRELLIREVRWVRVDVWRTNSALHAYYERRGFRRCGTCRIPSYPAGALFQKDVRESLKTDTSCLVEEDNAGTMDIASLWTSAQPSLGESDRRKVDVPSAGPPPGPEFLRWGRHPTLVCD